MESRAGATRCHVGTGALSDFNFEDFVDRSNFKDICKTYIPYAGQTSATTKAESGKVCHCTSSTDCTEKPDVPPIGIGSILDQSMPADQKFRQLGTTIRACISSALARTRG